MSKPTPEPLYCCANPACCEEHTWPAEDLWWSERKQNWYCTCCWDADDPVLNSEDPGESFAQYLSQ